MPSYKTEMSKIPPQWWTATFLCCSRNWVKTTRTLVAAEAFAATAIKTKTSTAGVYNKDVSSEQCISLG